jgi:5-(carboxyamino)imidazole ribonucleotide synthase
MVNLVGAEGYSEVTLFTKHRKILGWVYPYLQKKIAPFRKMGHVTIVNTDIGTSAEDVKTQLK